MKAGAAIDRGQRRGVRSERLAIHDQNCEALAEAYMRLRGQDRRALRYDIDALLQAVSMERELWEAGFNAAEFLQRFSPLLRRRYGLL